MENFGSAAQLFPGFRFGCWTHKIWRLSFLGGLTFPAFSSFFQISKIFQLMVQLFQPLQLLQLQLFQLFGIGPHIPPQARPRSRCGLPRSYARLVKFGRTVIYWKKC